MMNWIQILAGLPLPVAILLKITMVLSLGWIIHFSLAHSNPRWRVLLWRVVIVGVILVAVLAFSTYLQVPVKLPAVPVKINSANAVTEISPDETFATRQFPDDSVIQSDSISGTNYQTAGNVTHPAFSKTQWLKDHLWQIAISTWCFVTVLMSLQFLAGYNSIRKKIMASLPVPLHIQQLLNRIAGDFSCRGKINLRYSPDFGSPFLTGLTKPTIVLPRQMIEARYADDLPAIFAHELTHLTSRDLYWMIAARYLSLLLWFHPFTWKLLKTHNEACERVCDVIAADYIGNTEAYSNTLVRIALEIINPTPAIGGIPMAGSSEIIGRLRNLKKQFNPDCLSLRRVILSGLVSFITLTAIGGLTLVYAESDAGKSTTRVLHFPKDRSLGRIMVQDVNLKQQIQTFHYWINGVSKYGDEVYLGEAQGDVIIPSGKRVALFINETAGNDLSPLIQLDPNDLYSLTLAGSVNDSCMDYVTHLTGLRTLDLAGNITNRGMRNIIKLKSLERLRLSEKIGDAGLAQVTKLPSLKGLYFRQTQVTDKGLYLLAKLASLEELDLGGKFISDAGLVHLAKLPSLRYLILNDGNFSDAGLVYIANVPSLKILNLKHRPITDEGLRNLSGHTGLENLSLYNTEITNKGLVYLESMRSLKKLDIGSRNHQNPPVTDEGMVHIAKLKGLEYLDLPNDGITDEGLAAITNLKNLKHLWVCGSSNSPLTDKALQHVSKLQSLEYLLIQGAGFTNAGMDDLAKLTSLRELHLTADSITNEGLAKLKTLKSLEDLSLRCKNVTISGLAHLNAFKNISILNVVDVKQDNSGLDISGLTRLEKLGLSLQTKRIDGNLVHDELRDEDLACLAKLKSLKWLQIGYISKNRITDAGMANLAGLVNMDRLVIGSPYLTDKSLAYLKDMKHMNNMTIAGNFTDEGLKNLEGLKALSRLVINSANNFSPAALDRLRDNLPNLNSFSVNQEDKTMARRSN